MSLKKTGVNVKAWNKTEEGLVYLGDLDVSELKPGMIVRKIGPLLKINGATIDNDEDYYVSTEDGYYSPLCLE